MSHSLKIALAAGVCLVAAAGAAYAQNNEQNLLKYRQGIMRAVAFQNGPLNAFAKGEAPWSPAIAQRAVNLAALSVIAGDVFPPAGKDIPNTDAKPEIWLDPDGFKKSMTAFQTEAAKLADLARAGNADGVKAQVAAVGKTCGGCHDTYRVKR
ncbi:MAG: cytochrome c [Alphaproteobacteria bacterium]|nr:cytochrome c [Alphaproteobacteria bacterium]